MILTVTISHNLIISNSLSPQLMKMLISIHSLEHTIIYSLSLVDEDADIDTLARTHNYLHNVLFP